MSTAPGTGLDMKKINPLTVGIAGALFLLLIYFGIITASESFTYALDRFLEMPFWLSLLAAGFGTQIGLHHYIKTSLRKKTAGATASVAASGGISTVAMVACCAHHVTDVLPIVGLSGAAVFLAEYQFSLILLGVFSNLIGISMMLNIIQKHGLYPKTGIPKAVFAFNMRRMRNALIIFSLIAVPLYFFVFDSNAAPMVLEDADMAENFDLSAKLNKEKSVSIKVKPMDVGFNKPVQFKISINTHSGSLDFDLTAISFLEDDKGNSFKPISWKGSPPGGHHRSGMLSFPALKTGTKAIKLTIKNVHGVPERIFEWPLK